MGTWAGDKIRKKMVIRHHKQLEVPVITVANIIETFKLHGAEPPPTAPTPNVHMFTEEKMKLLK